MKNITGKHQQAQELSSA